MFPNRRRIVGRVAMNYFGVDWRILATKFRRRLRSTVRLLRGHHLGILRLFVTGTSLAHTCTLLRFLYNIAKTYSAAVLSTNFCAGPRRRRLSRAGKIQLGNNSRTSCIVEPKQSSHEDNSAHDTGLPVSVANLGCEKTGVPRPQPITTPGHIVLLLKCKG